jgi:hypothetical protein
VDGGGVGGDCGGWSGCEQAALALPERFGFFKVLLLILFLASPA